MGGPAMLSERSYLDEVELAELHHVLLQALKALMQPERDHVVAIKCIRRAREIVDLHTNFCNGRELRW